MQIVGLLGAALLVSGAGAWAQGSGGSSAIPQTLASIAALEAAGKWQQALDACGSIAAQAEGTPWKPLLQLRESRALFALGQAQPARILANAALAALPEDDAATADDRAQAWVNLAFSDETALEYDLAYQGYGRALHVAAGAEQKMEALRGRIATGTFVQPESTAEDVRQAEALIESQALKKQRIAILETAISQYYLNTGRPQQALDEGKHAVDHLGGFAGDTDTFDAAARGDVALAAFQLHDLPTARQYIAASGAGRSGGTFRAPSQAQLPECGGEAGLRPDDAAVIELWINDSGAVTRTAPVYATRPGEVALTFARAVAQWSWTAEAAKAMLPFYRSRIRVDLRCTTEFQHDSVTSFVREGFAQWLAASGVHLPPEREGGDAARLISDRAALAAAEAKGGDQLALVPALHALASNHALAGAERAAFARREAAIVADHHAPAVAKLGVALQLWWALTPDFSSKGLAPDLSRALRDPDYAADPVARAAIELMLVDSLHGPSQAVAEAMLRTIADDRALDASHPLKVGALVRLAALELKAGRLDQARLAFDRTGLREDECAMLDSQPKPITTMPDGHSLMPSLAMDWGFEGWVTVQFDLDAQGHPQNVRPVNAYPPFIYADTAPKFMASEIRYGAPFRPTSGPGCGGFLTKVLINLGH